MRLNCRCSRLGQAGFTLVELVIVIVVIGSVSAYAMVRNASAGPYSLRSQAELLAGHVRHVQTLSTTWGTSLRITSTSTGYSVSCVTATGSAPCNSSPVLNPVTGGAYSVTVKNGISLSGTATLDFDSFGKPSGSGSYTFGSGGATFTASVAALTGNVTVGSP